MYFIRVQLLPLLFYHYSQVVSSASLKNKNLQKINLSRKMVFLLEKNGILGVIALAMR